MIVTRQERSGIYVPHANKLLGFSDALQSLHWAAKGKDIHEYLDDFNDELRKYMDSVIEGCMGLYGKVVASDIEPDYLNDADPNTILDLIEDEVVNFKGVIQNSGITSLADDFLAIIGKYKYLFELTK